MRACSICENQFDLRPDHRGRANVCLACGGQDVEPLMAEVSWEGKQTPLIHVTTMDKARRFNAQQRRFGCSVLRSTVPGPGPRVGPVVHRAAGYDWEPPEVGEKQADSKRGSGAELGAVWVSRLGEKHNLKR